MNKYSHLATSYIVTVDDNVIGELEYPFEVKLNKYTLSELKQELAKRWNISQGGIQIVRISKSPRKEAESIIRTDLKGSAIIQIPFVGSVH